MEIVVFTKRVPVTQEEELRILEDGKPLGPEKLPYRMNDWDTYGVEEAVRMVEKGWRRRTSLAIGDAEANEVLRRAIAMGARDGFLLESEEVLVTLSQENFGLYSLEEGEHPLR